MRFLKWIGKGRNKNVRLLYEESELTFGFGDGRYLTGLTLLDLVVKTCICFCPLIFYFFLRREGR